MPEGNRVPTDMNFFSFNTEVSGKSDSSKEFLVFQQLALAIKCLMSSSYWRMNTLCQASEWNYILPRTNLLCKKDAVFPASSDGSSSLEALPFICMAFFTIRFTSVWKDHSPAMRIQFSGNTVESSILLYAFPVIYISRDLLLVVLWKPFTGINQCEPMLNTLTHCCRAHK